MSRTCPHCGHWLSNYDMMRLRPTVTTITGEEWLSKDDLPKDGVRHNDPHSAGDKSE